MEFLTMSLQRAHWNYEQGNCHLIGKLAWNQEEFCALVINNKPLLSVDQGIAYETILNYLYQGGNALLL